MKVLIESAKDGWLDNKHEYVSKLVEAKYHIVIEDGKSYIYIHDIDEIFKLIKVIGFDILLTDYIFPSWGYNLSDSEKEIKIINRFIIHDDYME